MKYFVQKKWIENRIKIYSIKTHKLFNKWDTVKSHGQVQGTIYSEIHFIGFMHGVGGDICL